MDPNNNPGQPLPPVSQTSANMAYLNQTQAMARPSSASAAPQTTGSNNNKLFAIGAIGAALLVFGLIIVGLLAGNSGGGANYQTTYETATVLYEDLSAFLYESGCNSVSTTVFDTYSTSANAYSKYIKSCQKDASAIYD